MNTTVMTEIEQYLAGVRAALADVPAETREELLEDLPAHLAEVAAEANGSLEERLGKPAVYAAELRAAAGLEGGAGSVAGAGSKTAAITARVRGAVERADVRLGPLIGYGRVSDFGRLLRPAWWVLRGYVVAMVLLGAIGGDPALLPTLSGRYGSSPAATLFGWLVALACVAASVRFGPHVDRLSSRAMVLVRAATVVVVLVVIVNVFVLDDRLAARADVPSTGYFDRSSQIQDIYVYDSSGHPLTGVQLFDQDGNPITLGEPYRCRTAGNWAPNGPGQSWTYPLCPQGPGMVTPSAAASGAPSAAASGAPSAAPSGAPSAAASPVPSSAATAFSPTPTAAR
jgi:HAAS